MTPTLRRLSVLVPSLVLGAAWAGLNALGSMPAGWGVADRLWAWAYMLTGPVFHIILGGGPVPDVVGLTVALGWLGLPAMAAHPLRPSVTTGILTALGAFFWFASGIVTMIMAVWGA